VLRPNVVRELSVPSPAQSLLAIAFDWALIAACFAAAISAETTDIPMWTKISVWILCYVFMARQQLALAILMHDGAHRRLMPSAKANDLICQFFCAAPLFFSMYSYQKLHLKHHRDPLAADDPDLSLIGGYPIPLRSFLRKLLRDASGLSYIKFIRYFIHMARNSKPKPIQNDRDVGPSELKTQSSTGSRISTVGIVTSILLMSLLLCSILIAVGHGWFFLIFWVLPAVTFLQVLLRIRGIAEHAGYSQNPDQRLNARTVINPLQTFFFAPHGVNFHIEHHVYPAVPFYNLPKLHRLMMAENLLPPTNLFQGYGKVLKDLVK
jgi:fatty acid desaturase